MFHHCVPAAPVPSPRSAGVRRAALLTVLGVAGLALTACGSSSHEFDEQQATEAVTHVLGDQVQILSSDDVDEMQQGMLTEGLEQLGDLEVTPEECSPDNEKWINQESLDSADSMGGMVVEMATEQPSVQGLTVMYMADTADAEDHMQLTRDHAETCDDYEMTVQSIPVTTETELEDTSVEEADEALAKTDVVTIDLSATGESGSQTQENVSTIARFGNVVATYIGDDDPEGKLNQLRGELGF